MKKFLSTALALCMVLAMSVTAFAAEIDTDGGSGSTPVYLSSTEDGSIDGAPSATAMSVTVPTALPMAMSQAGDVTTADNCQILNHIFHCRSCCYHYMRRLNMYFFQKFIDWDIVRIVSWSNYNYISD